MKLLKFGASWCSSCQTLSAKLKEEKVNEKTEIIDVDIEESDELVQKYNIRNIPVAILLDDEGEVLRRWHGFYPTLVKEIKESVS